MEVVTLNCWWGKSWDTLEGYLKEKARTTDVFLLQEVTASPHVDRLSVEGYRWNLLSRLKETLPGFVGYYSKLISNIGFDYRDTEDELHWGLGVFMKKTNDVRCIMSKCIYGRHLVGGLNEDFSNLPVGIQGISINTPKGPVSFFNFHGVFHPGDKLDTPQRLRQSDDVMTFMQKFRGAKVIGGDFNLMPQTRSVRKFEEGGYRNLVADYKVKSTRSSLSPYWNTPEKQLFADYVFTQGVKVHDFYADDVLVSDHLPLVLKFEV